MKSIIKHTRLGLVLAISLFFVCFSTQFAYASESPQKSYKSLDEETLNFYSLNEILYYDPSECTPLNGNTTAICGSTPKEKYWSALRQYYDEIHTAAIMGNIAKEGSFSPTRWQTTMLKDGGYHKYSWNKLYNCTGSDCPGGVGAFQITSRLGQYLQYIDTKNMPLLSYFQEPQNYSFGSDQIQEKISKIDFSKLVQLEVEYVVGIVNDEFKHTTTLEEATDWWTMHFENCANCCGAADSDSSCEQLSVRRAAAKKIYDELKNFECNDSNTDYVDSGSTNPSKITLIGDTVSMTAEASLASKFPSSFLTYTPTRSFTSGGGCPGDVGGISVLKKLTIGNQGILTLTSANGCETTLVNPYVLQENIIWEIGTYSAGATEKNLDKLLALVGDKKLFLVTPFNNYDRPGADKIAELYRTYSEKHNNVYVIDWNEKVRDNVAAYIGDDGINPTELGSDILASLIQDAITGARKCTTFEGEWPNYQQCSAPWGSMPYGGGTYCSCSCGASSLAMLATVATGQDIYPNDVGQLVWDGYYQGLGDPKIRAATFFRTSSGDLPGLYSQDKYVGDHYGFEVVAVRPDSKEEAPAKMKEYLDQGYMLHVTGWGEFPFSTIGHYIGIYKLKEDGTLVIANSAGRSGDTRLTLEYVSARMYGYTRSFVAVRGRGGGGCDLNICKDEEEDEESEEEDNASTSSVASTAKINPHANMKKLNKLFPNGIPTNASEMSPYLTGIRLTIVDKNCNRKTSSRTMRVHKDLADTFKQIFEEMADICFPVVNMGAYTWKEGENGPSAHAYGAAFDINTKANPLAHGCTRTDYRDKSNPETITPEVIAIWQKHGFTWGGNFRSCRDYMHFSYLGF